MKKSLICLSIIVSLLCLSGTVFARTVSVSGMGLTVAEAENDALRNAVEEAVGILIDSETLVRNHVLLQDEIYTKSRGFITNYTVRERRETASGWQVSIEADIDDSPNASLMAELTRLGIIDVKLRNPKIAVYVPEYHIQSRIPDPAGETAIINALLNSGFSNVIAAKPELVMSHAPGKANRPYTQMTIEDIQSVARFLEADILVLGEAFSEGVGDIGKYLPGHQQTRMQSCRARLEAKMYIAKTGQIIAADGKFASGTDISESIASKKALSSAGQQMGEFLAAELLNLGSGNRQGMEIHVNGRDFTEINLVQTALAKVKGVNDIQLSNYESGMGKITLHFSGSPERLFRELQGVCPLTLSLDSVTYNILHIRVE